MITLRGRGAANAYTVCRGFGLGRMHSLLRAALYLAIGRTGRYRIHWRPKA